MSRSSSSPINIAFRLTVGAVLIFLIPFQSMAAPVSVAPEVFFNNETRRYEVYPGNDIQAALEAAAKDKKNKTITVHAGTYKPDSARQALIWFNKRHDGILLEAEGEVILTAANPEIANKNDDSFPAVVNHVVYFGDGITRKTVFDGFKITGANNFFTTAGPNIESSTRLEKTLFFYKDGGGIKIFGKSYPIIRNIQVYDNYSNPCAGGISIEHDPDEPSRTPVLIENCVMRNNRAEVTGSAIDILWQGYAEINNCLFIDNISNMGTDWIGGAEPYNVEHGSGALTVFSSARADVSNSTFTNNWAGVDDRAKWSKYTNNIFWKNVLSGGISKGARYELDIINSDGVKGNFINGDLNDVQNNISNTNNKLDAPDPRFDKNYLPRSPEYSKVGYRPLQTTKDP